MATPTTSYTDARSAGGKIATKTRRRFNPYERPPPPSPSSPPQNSPNWFSGVIVPASRRIASSAAKVISSVFVSDSDSSSSSSGDSAHEDDAYNSNDHDTSLGIDKLNPETGNFSKEPQLSLEKSENKHVIEQLILQETFSREDCERLVKIINSRVVEHSDIEKRENVVPSDTPRDTVDPDSLNFSNEAVTEARKWIRERKVGPSPVSDFGTCGGYPDRLQNIESKVASPVDMAKAYMNARPPWASPSTEYIELRTPSMMTTRSGESCSPLKSSLASGSWNLQDEIRRVRSKATENMLQTLSSPRVDRLSFALSSRPTQEYIVADRVVDRIGDDILFNSPIGTKKVDGSGDLAAGMSTELGLSAFENRQDGSVDEASLPKDSIYIQERKQDSEAIQNEGDYVGPESHHFDSLGHTAEHHTDENLNSRNGPTEKEVKNYAETKNANGLPSSQASLSLGGISNEIHRHPAEGEGNLTSLNHEKPSCDIPMEEKVELLSEASVEVPVAYETDAQNSHEELSRGQNQPEETLDPAGTPESTPVKRQGKRPSRYIRRGRGRGKVIG